MVIKRISFKYGYHLYYYLDGKTIEILFRYIIKYHMDIKISFRYSGHVDII